VSRLTTIGKKPPIKEKNRFIRWGLKLVQDLFPVLLLTFLLLTLAETIFEGSINHYINLNQLLTIVIVVGVIALLTAPSKPKIIRRERLTAKGTFIIICAGLTGATVVWYKTQEIGWLAYVISAVSGGIIVLLSMLVWRGDEGEENEGENSQGS